ncbi:hypothetical protein FF38_12887 [Lucilia cuprina]|uniref:Uncharacterized protein n=1 Tax=Lucilia cuprina TaxID=7375 RepID=A0A0L0C094_LUCCU|nr:hypothetical protein FF38_12887 [Lucilia cuprina]
MLQMPSETTITSMRTPALAKASFNFSASSLGMSSLTTVGALSTNFLACTKFIPSNRFLTSLINATFCFSSNLTSLTLKEVCTFLGAASSSSSAAAAGLAGPAAICGTNEVSGRFSFFFKRALSSETSKRLRVAMLLAIPSNLGLTGLATPSAGGGVRLGAPVAAAAGAASENMRRLAWRHNCLANKRGANILFNLVVDTNFINILPKNL